MKKGLKMSKDEEWKAWRSPEGVWMIRHVYRDDHGRRCTAFPIAFTIPHRAKSDALLLEKTIKSLTLLSHDDK